MPPNPCRRRSGRNEGRGAVIEEYERLDGLAIADLVRKGDVTALEVLETAIERIDADNPAP